MLEFLKKSVFSKQDEPKEITIADIPTPLLEQIYRENEIKFYESFEAYKLVPPPVVVQDGVEKWGPWIGIAINLIIMIKVFFK